MKFEYDMYAQEGTREAAIALIQCTLKEDTLNKEVEVDKQTAFNKLWFKLEPMLEKAGIVTIEELRKDSCVIHFNEGKLVRHVGEGLETVDTSAFPEIEKELKAFVAYADERVAIYNARSKAINTEDRAAWETIYCFLDAQGMTRDSKNEYDLKLKDGRFITNRPESKSEEVNSILDKVLKLLK